MSQSICVEYDGNISNFEGHFASKTNRLRSFSHRIQRLMKKVKTTYGRYCVSGNEMNHDVTEYDF